MSRNMYFFYPGDLHMKGVGMLVGNFEKPLKKKHLQATACVFCNVKRFWAYPVAWLDKDQL